MTGNREQKGVFIVYNVVMDNLPVYKCYRATTMPVIDGVLNDPAWDVAPIITLVRSETGEPAVKETHARMCWDDDCLYIAFECVDSYIYGTFQNHDDPIYTEDVVEVFLSPDCDLTHYYELEVSPNNVTFDAEITTDNDRGDNMRGDITWECAGWRTAVNIEPNRGWTVEMAIPFSSLNRETPKPGEKWRGNLYRIDRIPEPVEHQAWSPTLADPAAFHRPHRFGVIEFVEG